MPRIAPVNLTDLPPEAQAAVDEHLRQGYRLTNEKLTLLHNVSAFEALEAQSYVVDRELQRLVGKRAATSLSTRSLWKMIVSCAPPISENSCEAWALRISRALPSRLRKSS